MLTEEEDKLAPIFLKFNYTIRAPNLKFFLIIDLFLLMPLNFWHRVGTDNSALGASYCNIKEVLVRVIGLEPTRPKAPEPKSGASTNFATPASK